MKILQKNDRFYIEDNGVEIAKIVFEYRNESTISAYETYVSTDLRGQGVAQQLLVKLVEFAREKNLKIVPVCSYVKKMFEKDSTYQDVYFKEEIKMNQPTFTLKNGVQIHAVGFGTWQIPNGDEAYNSTLEALKLGYRHIDTAMAYRNEESVGKAIKDSKVPREEIFVTTKLPAQIKGYEEAKKAFQESLDNLGLEYIDLYLIHAPKPWGAEKDAMDYMPENIASWKAFEELYKEGKIRSIGVSNFTPEHLSALMKETEIVPHANQILVHPHHIPSENIAFCKENHILVEAYSPLATGRIFSDASLAELAKKYNKTVAQLCIRWSYQNGLLPLPKSVTPSRIKENFEIFDFEISKEDMDKIGKIA